jgi:hypothetical protein
MLVRYFLYDVPVACVVTGITFVFTVYILCVCIVRSLCSNIFSACFLIRFLSHKILMPINLLLLLLLLLLNSVTTVDAKKLVRIQRKSVGSCYNIYFSLIQ